MDTHESYLISLNQRLAATPSGNNRGKSEICHGTDDGQNCYSQENLKQGESGPVLHTLVIPVCVFR